MLFIVSMTSRHLEPRGYCMSDASTKPCCSSVCCIVSRVWPCWVCVLSLKGFTFVNRVYAHSHQWSLMIHPFSHHDVPQANKHTDDIWSFTLIFCCHTCFFFSPFAAWGNREGAAPVKLHLWHSDHSTYFNSFRVTSSLFLTSSERWLVRCPTVHAARTGDWNIFPVSHRWTSLWNTNESPLPHLWFMFRVDDVRHDKLHEKSPGKCLHLAHTRECFIWLLYSFVG